MKRLVLTAGLLAALSATPAALLAQNRGGTGRTWGGCVSEAVESCDKDFRGGDKYTVAIRGWCYMIRASLCRVGL